MLTHYGKGLGRKERRRRVLRSRWPKRSVLLHGRSLHPPRSKVEPVSVGPVCGDTTPHVDVICGRTKGGRSRLEKQWGSRNKEFVSTDTVFHDSQGSLGNGSLTWNTAEDFHGSSTSCSWDVRTYFQEVSVVRTSSGSRIALTTKDGRDKDERSDFERNRFWDSTHTDWELGDTSTLWFQRFPRQYPTQFDSVFISDSLFGNPCITRSRVFRVHPFDSELMGPGVWLSNRPIPDLKSRPGFRCKNKDRSLQF